jgi:superfamily II DNA or RNA helicase
MDKIAKIVIHDEVNAKIHNLDIRVARKLYKEFEFEEPGSFFSPARQLGHWNGKTSFFQLGGRTFVSLLEKIIPMLDDMGYDFELEDNRKRQPKFTFDPILEDTFSTTVWPKNHIAEGEPIKLRDYQVEVINHFLTNNRAIQEVATGAGKTLITAALSKSCEPYGRTIVIVPNKSLVTQTEEDYVNMGLDVGVYFGDRKDFGKTHTICTWQSMGILLKNTANKTAEFTMEEFIENVCCVIVDEAHMAKADMLKSILSDALGDVPLRWGLTGTVPKDDFEGYSLFTSIGHVVNQISTAELQERGILAKCHVNIQQFMDDKEYDNYQSELSYITTNPERLDAIAKQLNSIREGGNVLVLVDRVACGKALVALLDDAIFISGSMKTKKRKEYYDQIAEEDRKIIVATYGVAAVGINVPRIFNLVLIEPGKSFVRVIQSIGRGVRKAKDKDFVQIWDITSNCKFAKRHLTKRKKFYRESAFPFTINKIRWK